MGFLLNVGTRRLVKFQVVSHLFTFAISLCRTLTRKLEFAPLLYTVSSPRVAGVRSAQANTQRVGK